MEECFTHRRVVTADHFTVRDLEMKKKRFMHTIQCDCEALDVSYIRINDKGGTCLSYEADTM